MRPARSLVYGLTLSCALGAALFACKKEESPTPASVPAAAPATPLTLPRLKQARLLIKVPGRLTEAVAAVERVLGAPTRREVTRVSWSVVAGQDCHELAIDAHPTGELRAAGIQSASKLTQALFDQCAANAPVAAK